MPRVAGIRYATAERFEPPALVPWDGSRPREFGPSAPQRTSGPLVEAVPGMAVGATNEDDCLSLNVWAPEGAEGLPVMVWIHGGAFVIGGSSLETYDAARLSETQRVVVVSCNYRLGGLGHMNRGLLDQMAALRWVQDNIAAFGGDPGNVTVFGESAGAGSILHLLGAPAADGLFRRAILQSPGSETVPRDRAEALSAAFVRHLEDKSVLDAQEAAAAELAAQFGSMPWQPVIDGDVVPIDPKDRVASGALAGVDVLLGTTSEELRLFTGAMVGLPVEALAGVLRHLLTDDPGQDAAEALVRAYDGDVEVLSDAAMGVPVVRLSDELAAHNPRTFAYRFDWSAPTVGACHAIDLPFTFGTFDRCGWDEFVGYDDDARALSDRMMAAWASFARTGDPGWPAYGADARQTMIFGRTDRIAEHPLAARLHLHEGART